MVRNILARETVLSKLGETWNLSSSQINELRNKINSAKRLLESLDNTNNRLYQNVEKQLGLLISEYKEMPIITNNDVLELVTSVSEDRAFKQYMYFESIKYIKKLKTATYEPLINICLIKDEDERITAFNQWCQNDYNIRLLELVFPVIITTNISAARLGTAKHTFDLVIMELCYCPTSNSTC